MRLQMWCPKCVNWNKLIDLLTRTHSAGKNTAGADSACYMFDTDAAL